MAATVTIALALVTLGGVTKDRNCGKIGFLPDGLWLAGINISSTDLCEDINR